MSSPETTMPLSKTGERWLETMSRIYDNETLSPIIQRASRVARERGGRCITREDLNEALDIIANQELVSAIMGGTF